MSEPWIGDETEAAPGACGFAGQPGAPRCILQATVHLMSESAIYGAVSLATCDIHAPVARESGPLLAEHPYGPGCVSRETWFRADDCVPAESSGGAQ